MLAFGTGNFFKAIGHIRLSSKVKLHIRVHRKIVPAFQADGSAFSIWLQRAPIDTEGIGFTDCALDTRQPLFYYL
ncbi:MAG: hypothetical protein KA426_10780 [Nitrospira sp.]|jgi:hypothetical protein|nr:hypothetical protein [Nitrospira sp.]